MFGKKIQTIIKRMNPRAKSWCDQRLMLQSGSSGHVFCFSR
ncbi:MAG TPA: hypothetical protein VLT35_07735 [Methanocella sp.]|nr:hypothetical protein [Methanocella sp.]